MKVKNSILRAALTRCLLLCSDDTSRIEHLGVTFIPADDGVHLFSTEPAAMTRVVIKGAFVKRRVLIPKEFCAVLLTLVEDPDAIVNLEIADDCALVKTKRASLFARLLEPEKPLPFQSNLDSYFHAKARKCMIPIPDFLTNAAARAVVMADGKLPVMRIIIRDNRFKLTVGREWGRISDGKDLTETHPDISASLNPRLLKDAIQLYDRMCLTDSALVLTDGNGGTFVLAQWEK